MLNIIEIIRIGNEFVLTNVIIIRHICSEYMNKNMTSFKTFRYLKPQIKQIQTKIVSYTPQKYKTKERNPLLGTFAIFSVWFTVDSGEWTQKGVHSSDATDVTAGMLFPGPTCEMIQNTFWGILLLTLCSAGICILLNKSFAYAKQ